MAEVNTPIKPNVPVQPQPQKTASEPPKTGAPSSGDKKIIKGAVTEHKKTLSERIANTFVATKPKDVASYVLNEFVVPTMKKLVWEAISNGAYYMINGTANRNPRFPQQPNVSNYTPYSRVYVDRGQPVDPYAPRYDTRQYDYRDLTFNSREDAADVLWRLRDDIRQYGCAPVANYLEYAGVTPDYTDHNYGWYNLETSDVIAVPGGYKIRFPRAVPMRK